MSSPDERGFIPSLPDWLKAEKPTSVLSAAQAPDWLTAEKPNRSLIAPSLPEWLGGAAQTLSKGTAGPAVSSQAEPSLDDEAAPDISISDFRRQMATSEIEVEALLGTAPGGQSEESGKEDAEDLLAASPLLATDSSITEGDVTPLEIPDWLGGSEPSPTAREDAQPFGGVPDWLSDAKPDAGVAETKPEPATTDVPDWLSEAAPPPPSDKGSDLLADWLSDTAPPPPGTASDDAPGWIKSVEATATSEPEKPTPLPDEVQPSADLADLLSAPSPTTSGDPGADSTPDWLNAMATPESAKTDAPVSTGVEATVPAPVGGDAPDWLNAFAEDGGTKPPQPDTPQPSPQIGDAPDWLNALAEGNATAASEPASKQSSSAGGDAPDWLNALAEGEAGKASEPTSASAPIQSSPVNPDAPDWLNAFAEGDAKASEPLPSTVSTQPAPVSPDAPDWLNAASAPQPASVGQPPAEGSVPDSEQEKSDSLLDWMQSPDFGLAPPADVPGDGEDLLGLSMDLAAPSAGQAEEEDSAVVPGELPEWLRGFKPTSDASEPISSEFLHTDVSPELISQLSDLRYDTIIGEQGPDVAANTEKVGALKDVTGAIKPELIFDAQSLKVSGLVSDTVLSKEQGRRLEMLESLLSERGQELSIPGKGRAAVPFVRWLLTLAVLAAVAAPIIGGLKLVPLSPSQNAGPTAVHDAIAALPEESHVVVAFEYGPDTAGEMEPIASVLFDDLAAQVGSVVYMVSTRPTGPSMAERAINALEETSSAATEDWVNLGYIPGGSNGISALTLGAPAGMISPFGQDYRNQPTGITATNLDGLKPDLLIVISDEPEDLRNWIEQAGEPMNIPLVAITSASVAPMVGPYIQSGQITALMSGYNDAIAYQSLSEEPLDESQSLIWQGQALGSLVAAAVIIIAGAIYGFISLRELREQES
jgi:hypothetical protein